MRERVLQAVFADLVLDPDEAPFQADPRGYGLARGLSRGDAEAIAVQAPRFGLYRELARNNLVAPLENDFPILQQLLGEDAWGEAVAAFLAARTLDSPYYRDIAPAFVAWLHGSGWGLGRWPAILELAHYELMEIIVSRWPDAPEPRGLFREILAEGRLVLDPAAQVLSYAHAVHRATESDPEPAAESCHLLLHRSPDGAFQVLELTASTAALLVRAQSEPLGQALAALDLENDTALDTLFQDLMDRGALLGFRA